MQTLFSKPAPVLLLTDYDAGMKRRTPSQVGSRIAALREALGLTQRQLAEKIGVPYSNIGYWECGADAPPGNILPKLVTVLSVTVDELLGVIPMKPKRLAAKGRLQQVFEAASRLPRRQQEKVAEFVEAFVNQQSNGHTKAA